MKNLSLSNYRFLKSAFDLKFCFDIKVKVRFCLEKQKGT